MEPAAERGHPFPHADQALLRARLCGRRSGGGETNAIVNNAHMEHFFISKQKYIDLRGMGVLAHIGHCLVDTIIELSRIDKGQ